MNYQEIANRWRQENAWECPYVLDSGIVLIWEGEAYAWRNKIRDASTERTGVIAVDLEGILYQAEGGNDEDGAKAWVVLK